jgi:hypothetical protein
MNAKMVGMSDWKMSQGDSEDDYDSKFTDSE